jgi:hypothetical protein
MSNTSEQLVQQAIEIVRHQTPLPHQADLLNILGVFAEPLIDHERFIRIIGREKLMASDLISYLVEEKLSEIEAKLEAQFEAKYAQLEAQLEAEAEKAQLEAERATQKINALEQERTCVNLQQALVESLVMRFQQVPAEVFNTIWKIHNPERLIRLSVEVVRATDIEQFVQTLQQAVQADKGS